MINPLLIKPGQSVGYGMQLDEIMLLPYSRAEQLLEFLGDAWEKEQTEINNAKKGR